MNSAELFLSSAELTTLTGWKHKDKRIDQLRRMGIRFWITASGKPVVPRSAIEGGKIEQAPTAWAPEVMQ